MDSRELSAAVAEGMSFDDLAGQLEPLIGKYSRWRIRGFEREDLRQEVLMVIWRCHGMYDPAKGSFLNLVIRSIENKIEHLRARSVRYYEPIAALRCRGCGVEAARRARGGRCACGSTRWDAVRLPYGMLSLDEVVGEDDRQGVPRVVVNPGVVDGGFERADDVLYVQDVLVGLESRLMDVAKRLTRGEIVTQGERAALAAAFAV